MNSLKVISFHIFLISFFILSFFIILSSAYAQEIKLAQSSSTQSQIGSSGTDIKMFSYLESKLSGEGIFRKFQDSTSLSYYHQFLGPTLKGKSSETYNIFQEGINQPGTGRAPLQSFHSINLRFRINHDWAIGTSLAAVDSYTRAVENKGGVINSSEGSFFNLRAYISLPTYQTRLGELYSTVSYEAPTSVVSRNDNMLWGLVINESFSFKSPFPSLSYGIMGQYYRSFFSYKNNLKPAAFEGGAPTELQTVIISGGPFLNYRLNDQWQIGSLVTLDWDQKGKKTDTTNFNNNLPHRGRIGFTYFPQRSEYLSSLGLFSQAMIKFRPETTALGAEFSLKFN